MQAAVGQPKVYTTYRLGAICTLFILHRCSYKQLKLIPFVLMKDCFDDFLFCLFVSVVAVKDIWKEVCDLSLSLFAFSFSSFGRSSVSV